MELTTADMTIAQAAPLRVSRVVATVGRTSELARLSASIAPRRMRSFVVTVVVQNDCNRSRPVFAAFDTALRFVYLRRPRELPRSCTKRVGEHPFNPAAKTPTSARHAG